MTAHSIPIADINRLRSLAQVSLEVRSEYWDGWSQCPKSIGRAVSVFPDFSFRQLQPMTIAAGPPGSAF